jgi:hypothetical protein
MKYMNWEFIFGELYGTFSIVSLIVADMNFELMVRGEPLSIKLTSPSTPNLFVFFWMFVKSYGGCCLVSPGHLSPFVL